MYELRALSPLPQLRRELLLEQHHIQSHNFIITKASPAIPAEGAYLNLTTKLCRQFSARMCSLRPGRRRYSRLSSSRINHRCLNSVIPPLLFSRLSERLALACRI